MNNYKLFINGEFVDSKSNKTTAVINPSTEEIVSHVPQGVESDVQQAVKHAKEAQKNWGLLPAIKRAQYLSAIAKEIRKNKEHLKNIISEEQGKILSLADAEVNTAADTLDFIAGWARRYEGDIVQSDREKENILIFKQPIGVIGGILPWNFPFTLIARKMAPALLAGNSIIIKPATDTPNSAFEFAKIVSEVGLPKGIFNVVSGDRTVGNALVTHPDVDMITFTGSTSTGAQIMKDASDTIKKVSLELGGKAPAIVMDDADIDIAVDAIVNSRIVNSGQVCICAERVYVQEGIYDEFVRRYIEKMSSVTYGNPLQQGIDMGPLINENQLKGVEKKVEYAIQQGAKLALGGERGEQEKGFYYKPTVLLECRQEMEIVQEEVFGPVTPIVKFKTLDDAIEMANDSDYGLSSSIYSNNVNTIMRLCNELEYGETYVNRENAEALNGFHTGWKKSGLGGEDGKYGLEEYFNKHTVYMKYY